MKRILIVCGTRPEAIKLAPLVRAFKRRPDRFSTFVCVTGQHRKMLDQVLSLFEIQPDFDLNIMKANQDLYDVTSGVLTGMRDVLTDLKPDVVIVQGDTTSSTAAALAAFYQQIPVAHVEAGLRTHNIASPWPEEMNRQITGRIATFHFPPTEESKANLLAEGVPAQRMLVTGNTVIDALQWVVARIKAENGIAAGIRSRLALEGYNIDRLDAQRRVVLITGHRRENLGEGFVSICKAIQKLSGLYPQVDFVCPLHLNPKVRKPAEKYLGNNRKLANVFLLKPIGYLSFVYLMSRSYFVLTDSGGIQEEAPGLGKPVLVMRDTTERPEAVAAGTAALVGTDCEGIVGSVSRLLEQTSMYRSMARAHNPYGDGRASERIVRFIGKQ